MLILKVVNVVDKLSYDYLSNNYKYLFINNLLKGDLVFCENLSTTFKKFLDNTSEFLLILSKIKFTLRLKKLNLSIGKKTLMTYRTGV